MLMAATALLSVLAAAQPSSEAPTAFTIKTYRVPIDDLGLEPPALPSPQATIEEQKNFVKSSHDVVKKFLEKQEIVLPPGSLACYDAKSYTLSLRSTEMVHEIMTSLENSILRNATKNVSWRLEIIEAPAADVQVMLTQALGKNDHSAIQETLAMKGKATRTLRGETRGGTAATSRQGSRLVMPTDSTSNSGGKSGMVPEEVLIGTDFYFDPVIGEGMVDINYRLQQRDPPLAPAPQAPPSGSDYQIECPLFDIKSSTVMGNGKTRLVGVWQIKSPSLPDPVGSMRAAFLTTRVVRVLDPVEPLVEALLRARGESVEPTPKKAGADGGHTVPQGMILRRFAVPPDFETMSAAPPSDASNPAADPFADGASAASAPEVRHTMTQQILRDQGIPFPKGAWAYFQHATTEMVVCNTPENMALVEAFMESLRGNPPKLPQFSLHIIEADAPMVREWMRESEQGLDHNMTWKAVQTGMTQGKAREIRTAWIEGRGGQISTHRNIIEHVYAKPKTEGKEPAMANEPGCVIELDPIMGESGLIDLNINIRDSAMPRTAGKPGEVPQTSFTNSFSMTQGTTRLVNVYTPAETLGQKQDVLHAVFLRAAVIQVP